MSTGLNRIQSDKFYTIDYIARVCFQYFLLHVSPHQLDTIIEPSAGNGSFSNLLHQFTNSHAFDIQPEHPSIAEQDFFTLDLSTYQTPIHFIGNPPFGRQSGVAKRFIKKAAEVASSISFILPKSFKKESMNKAFPQNFHKVFEYDIPKNSFTIDSKPHHVECVFQIWIKRDHHREKIIIVTPSFYTYVKKDEDPDISIRRVGVNAGKVSVSIEEKSSQSHYFLKLKDITIDKFVDAYTSHIHFSHNNSVGPKSISKTELDQAITDNIDRFL